MVRLGILRNGALVRANLGAVLLVGSFVGFQFIAVLHLQELRSWTELQTGLALMVIGIDSVLAPTLTPWLVGRFGNGRVIFGGFAFAAVGYALFLPLSAEWSYPAMAPSLILLGLAFSLAYGPLTIAATDGISQQEQGLASGVLTTSFQFGSALGLAVVAAVLAAADELTGRRVPVRPPGSAGRGRARTARGTAGTESLRIRLTACSYQEVLHSAHCGKPFRSARIVIGKSTQTFLTGRKSPAHPEPLPPPLTSDFSAMATQRKASVKVLAGLFRGAAFCGVLSICPASGSPLEN